MTGGAEKTTMLIIKDTIDISYDLPTVVTLGKFSGIHRGHMELIDHVIAYEQEHFVDGIHPTSCACCFQVSPMGIFSREERREVMRKEGIKLLVECPFVPELITMNPRQFVARILVGGLHAVHVVVGEDYRFGYQRQGNAHTLRELGREFNFTVETVPKVKDDGLIISSTRIRAALSQGDIETVNRLLGYPYFVNGKVIHGRRIGRSIGFPTTNVIPDQGKILPPNGVYAVRSVLGGKTYNGITNIGTKPTVDGRFVGVETFLYDCNEDFYGEEQKVELLHFMRPEKKFPTLDALKQQIIWDREEGENYFRKS